jgi:hypothetical protein
LENVGEKIAIIDKAINQDIVKELYAKCLEPEDEIFILEHPSVPIGMFWGCFKATREQFNNRKEYARFLNKFNEKHIRTSSEDSGIVHVNDHYYLRIPSKIISARIHATPYQYKKGAPILLIFDRVHTHKEHEDLMQTTAPNPIETYAKLAGPILLPPLQTERLGMDS